MKKCSNCGFESKDHEKFCINCGTMFPDPSNNIHNSSQQESVPPNNLNNTMEQPTMEPSHPSHSPNHPESIPFQQGEFQQPQQICTNCGRVSVNPSRFCLECGAPLTEVPMNNQTFQNDQAKRTQYDQPQKVKKPLSLGAKIGIISAIVLIGLAIGAHFFIQNMLDPKGQLDKITQYFKDGDEEQFTNSFVFPDGTYVEPKAFYQYVEDNDWIIDDLDEAVQDVKNGAIIGIVYNENHDRLMSVKQEDFLFFYKKTVFQVIPVEFSVYNYFPDFESTLKIGEQKAVNISKEETKIGSFAPGIYKYTLNYKDDYFEETINEEVIISGTGKNKYTYEIDLSPNFIYLSSDIDDATVFINGKDTGKTPYEIEFIAAPLDGSVEIYAEATNENGETIQSETLYLTEYDTHIYFAEIQELYEIQDFYDYYSYDAEDMFYSFRWDYQYAVNMADFSYVEDYFIDGSQLQNNYETFVVDHEDIGFYYYDFISNEVIDSYPLSANSLIVETLETFEFYSEEDGTWHYEREKRYTFEYVDGMLKIANIEDIREVNKTKID